MSPQLLFLFSWEQLYVNILSLSSCNVALADTQEDQTISYTLLDLPQIYFLCQSDHSHFFSSRICHSSILLSFLRIVVVVVFAVVVVVVVVIVVTLLYID